VLKARI
jgi:hypothetical protein